jgi:hypothetical protein
LEKEIVSFLISCKNKGRTDVSTNIEDLTIVKYNYKGGREKGAQEVSRDLKWQEEIILPGETGLRERRLAA